MFQMLTGAIVFIYGICIGSFLNVCIYRIPISKSIVSPGSCCSSCNKPIRFYDNIPLLSYFFLRGKCRACNAPISFRYPAIELLTGIFSLLTYLKFGLTISGIIYFAFIATLIVISFIDFDHRIIPDIISLPGILVFFILSFFVKNMAFVEALKFSILGLLSGGGSLFAVAWMYHAITGKDGMGGGDIKLLAMMGPLIGWQGVFFTIFSSSAIGVICGVIAMIPQKQMSGKFAIPFGPFLSVGAVLYIFFGNQIIQWYLTTFMLRQI